MSHLGCHSMGCVSASPAILNDEPGISKWNVVTQTTWNMQESVFEWFLHFQKIWVLSKNGGVGSYTCDGAMLHHALQNLRRQRLFPRVADPCLSTIRLWVKIGYPIRWLIPNMYPLVNIQIAIENGPVEIVDLPIKHGDFPYVKLPGTFQSVVIYPLVN